MFLRLLHGRLQGVCWEGPWQLIQCLRSSLPYRRRDLSSHSGDQELHRQGGCRSRKCNLYCRILQEPLDVRAARWNVMSASIFKGGVARIAFLKAMDRSRCA